MPATARNQGAERIRTAVIPQRRFFEVSARSEGIYFVQELEGGPVKIGLAADIDARMRALRCGNWRELRVLAYVIGPSGLEKWLHRRLAHQCVAGEWFEPSDDLFRLLRICLERYGEAWMREAA